MAANELIPWINSAGEGGVRNSMQDFPGAGTTGPFEFNFAGGYIDQSHVKAYRYDPVTALTFPQTLTFVGPNQVRTSDSIPVGQFVVIYRDTPKDKPLVDYSEGAVMDETNLDKSNDQNVFIAAEMLDRFDTINATSSEAIQRSILAYDTANAATDASNKATDASNKATATANSALSASGTAVSTANDAHDIATGIDAKAQSALDASATAVSTANAAKDTADGIDAKATKAMSDAAASVTTANKAGADASTALSTANTVSGKADGAVSTANAAKAAADNAYQKSGGDVSGEVVQTTSNGFRIVYGNFGTFMRNDNDSFYLMTTNPGDQRGSYSGYRPFAFKLGSGAVSIDGTGAGTTFGGIATVQKQVIINGSSRGNYGEVELRSGDGTFMRMRGRASAGGMEWVNNAYNAVVGTMDDGGSVQFQQITGRGRIIANEHLWSLNSVYAGNGSALMSTDGNINGGAWGGWLSNWISANFATNGKVDGNWSNEQNQINNLQGQINDRAKGGRYTLTYDSGIGHTNFQVDATLVCFVANNVSDRRLKDNIALVEDRDALTKINAIKFYTYDWKDNQRHEDFGYVAQQLRNVDPRYVFEPPEGCDPLTSPLGFNDQTLLRDALRAIQQLSAEVEALKATTK